MKYLLSGECRNTGRTWFKKNIIFLLSKKLGTQNCYEENIKNFGTLTCVCCLKPIKFGQDTLEHKIPLSRGGKNEFTNLAIACFQCNCRKNKKTEKEYRRILRYVQN